MIKSIAIYSHNFFQSGKGAFQSDIVLKTFSFHLKQAFDSKFDWDGNPGGALALCTAVVHAISLQPSI